MPELTGRIALVTGGGRGIGREVALALASAGADVAVAARSTSDLAETLSRIRAAGRQGEAIVCDVGERPQVDAMIARVKSTLGDPLILVNNAGIAGGAKLTDTTDEMWDRMLRVNATGAFYCTRAVLPMMLSGKWSGNPVRTSTTRSFTPSSTAAARCTTWARLMAHTASRRGLTHPAR